jgi:hypothetical protein
MDAAQHPIEWRGKQYPSGFWVTVGLAQLNSGEDSQTGVCLPAPFDGLEVAVNIEDSVRTADPVGVLSEGDRW